MANVITINENGITMKVAKFGCGPKTLVMIPGLTISEVTKSADAVEKQYSIFLENYTIYLFEQRENVPDNYGILDMTNDILSVIDYLKLSDIYFFGASLGGILVESLAIARPMIAMKIAVASTTYKLTDAFSDMTNKCYQLSIKNSRKELSEYFSSVVYSENTLTKFKDYFSEIYKSYTDFEIEKFNKLVKEPFAFNFEKELSKIFCDVLVLGSKGDKLFTEEEMKTIANKTNGQIFLYNKEYGHGVYDEAPDFTSRLFTFFEQ